MEQIITHFTDTDLYEFTVQYYVLETYPRAEVQYEFFDRNNTVYSNEFYTELVRQIKLMENVRITEEEIEFMKRKCYFLPEWYYTFLRGYKYNPDEVFVNLSMNGKLSIVIRGKWYSTILWEIPILAIISELKHTMDGDMEKYDAEAEYNKALNKIFDWTRRGLRISDMGTRRRFSFENQRTVLSAFSFAAKEMVKSQYFVGTSNVWFAKEFGLTPIGTMSHQVISFEENVSGPFECNNQAMRHWLDVYSGNNGIYLYDLLGDKLFFDNFQTLYAKTFDGLRVDSGDEFEQVEKIIAKYKEQGIDPATKAVVFSNSLDIDKADAIHRYVNGRLNDSYGIGTFLTCDVNDVKPMNIVIKLTKSRITEKREWHDCVKLSCDVGKETGNKEKCDYLRKIIG